MDSIYIKKHESKDKTYAQKGFRSFLYRYIDSGFRTKWCGFWVAPLKIIEYYAYAVDGEWLDINNQARFALDKEKGTHRYNLIKKELEVSETAFVPLDMKSMISILEVKNNSSKDKKINISLEAAVNMRTKDENWHAREYNTNYSKVRRCIDITSDEINGFSRIGIGKAEGATFKFNDNAQYKEHYPDNEKQRCFIPGEINVEVNVKAGKTKKIPFIISGSNISKDDLSQNYDHSISNWKTMVTDKKKLFTKLFTTERIETGNNEIDNAFSWSAVNLANLIQNGKDSLGMFAGLPWFQRFWSRDTLWSIFGLVDIGEFYAAKQCLSDIAKEYDKHIPTVTDISGKSDYYSCDTDPLFILALDYYVKTTGDREFEKEMKRIVDIIEKSLKLDKIGLVKTRPDGSWMDSYDRFGTEIEIQSLWAEALKVIGSKKYKNIEKTIDSHFWNMLNNYPRDTSTDEAMTINCTVPIMFGQFPKSRSVIALNRIHEEFKTDYGVRTRSPYAEGYESSGYHKGASWGLTTGWAAAAYLSQGMGDDGADCLRTMAGEVDKNQISAMAECVDSESGKLRGATMQAWSHAMYIHAIDRYMFGIVADMKKNVINITPNFPIKWKSVARFGKKMGYYSMNLRIDQDNKKIEMRILFSSDPKAKGVINMPYGVKKITVGRTKHKGDSCEIKFKKENKIVGYF
ncbi:MAG: hypothetical protein GQ477_03925 [Nanohaloarchaea archaeon]|nr:hypothetical protein [Candidatus Nanohaloarchaea archaeon]